MKSRSRAIGLVFILGGANLAFSQEPPSIPASKLAVPKIVTINDDLRVSHNLAKDGDDYVLAGASGLLNSLVPLWMTSVPYLSYLNGSGSSEAYQAKVPNLANPIGDVVGTVTGPTGDRPAVWPEGSNNPVLLILTNGNLGQATRINIQGRRMGWQTVGQFERPFVQFGDPTLPSTYRDLLSNQSLYSAGRAEAIDDQGNIGGWVLDSNGNQQICYWQAGANFSYSAPVIVPGLIGSVKHISTSGGTRLMGWDTAVNKPFYAKETLLTPVVLHFGKGGEMLEPTQADDSTFASSMPSQVAPCIFVLPEDGPRLVDGVGAADDIRSIMVPMNPSDVTAATKATGIVGRTLGGTDLGGGNFWIAPPSNAWDLSNFLSLTVNVGVDESGAGTQDSDCAFVDGLLKKFKKGITPIPGEFAKFTVEHIFSVAPFSPDTYFRLTSRVQGNYEVWMQFFDWTSGSYDPLFQVGTNSVNMKTIDVQMSHPKYFSPDPTPHFKVRISLRNGIGSVIKPSWDIEQACGVTRRF